MFLGMVRDCLLGIESARVHGYTPATHAAPGSCSPRLHGAIAPTGVWTAETPHCDVLHVRGQVMTALAFASAGVLQLFMDASSKRISVAWQVCREGVP